jgi:tRNA-specific 2-thiouridylase
MDIMLNNYSISTYIIINNSNIVNNILTVCAPYFTGVLSLNCMKVIVGMSGGIDSSLAAYLLKKAGYEVEGLSFMLFETRGRAAPTACCSMEALEDAEKTASHIGIAHTAMDLRNAFIEKVIEPFAEGYLKGSTPNPCILCNREIKFPYLLAEARRRGAGFIATGHYAVVEHTAMGSFLKKGADPAKDQSYVLYALRKEELERLLLPLGPMRKVETRRMAREAGLPVSGRPESQEICFVGQDDYSAFISALRPGAARPGPIVDREGRPLGTHRGVFAYTVGQRKGLGISSPEPLYVTEIDAGNNTIRVGPREAVMRKECFVQDLNWLVPRETDFRADVKIRSMMKAAPALVMFLPEDTLQVAFDEPRFAPSPGQAAVFYEDGLLIGGGIIKPF